MLQQIHGSFEMTTVKKEEREMNMTESPKWLMYIKQQQ